MKKKKLIPKIWLTIKQSRLFRILSVLNIAFIIFILIFIFVAIFYSQKAADNRSEVEKNQQALLNLQRIAINQQRENSLNYLEEKSFAEFNEVIPFIAFLEDLFDEVDSEAMVSITTQENQIFSQRFADYSIRADIENIDTLTNTLSELQESRFITKLIDLKFEYEQSAFEPINQPKQIELALRLFLK